MRLPGLPLQARGPRRPGRRDKRERPLLEQGVPRDERAELPVALRLYPECRGRLWGLAARLRGLDRLHRRTEIRLRVGPRGHDRVQMDRGQPGYRARLRGDQDQAERSRVGLNPDLEGLVRART